MASSTAVLMVQCQMALGLNQREFAALLGRDRRTIQRWQDKGMALDPTQAEALSSALRPTRPDLADQIVELGRQYAERAGLPGPVVPASPEVISAILEAAAAAGEAGAARAEGMRAAVTAAFLKAAEAGVDVEAVIAGLRAGK